MEPVPGVNPAPASPMPSAHPNAPSGAISSVGEPAPASAGAPPSATPAPPSPNPATEVFDSTLGASPELYKGRGRKEILRESYVPPRLPHREHQIRQVAQVLAPALRGDLPSNLLIYGKIGTGKTAVVAQVRTDLSKRADSESPIRFITINCGNVDTPYSLVQTIGNTFAARPAEQIPTGWSLDRVQERMRELMDAEEATVILVLDEIDRLVAKSGSDVLYTLAELNSTLRRARFVLVGISNDLKFTNQLDARVRSRLSEEKIVFPPYDAPQLQDILKDRAQEVFKDGVLDAGVIERCAAYAALENGDARRALALLRVAAEMAERDRAKRITGDHVVKAKSRLEQDIILECVKTLPPHCKVLLYAILQAFERRRGGVLTGEVYDGYARLTQRLGLQPLHARSISNYLSELENLGLIRATIVSRGRGGRTREIVVDVPISETLPALEEDPLLAALGRPRNRNQMLLTNFDNPGRGVGGF